MNKTTLSPIIAGTMNWGVWDKNLTSKEMLNMIHVCLENKITTLTMPIFTVLTPLKVLLESICFQQ
jgi:hypothetical protein